MDNCRVAIVGATSLMGEELVRVLEQRNFPLASLQLYAADGTAGRTVYAAHHAYIVQPIEHSSDRSSFKDTDLVFFIGADDISRHLIPQAMRLGATVIDNSTVYRMEPDVPLIVPEVNMAEAENHRGIIACPDCSTIILNVVLNPLHKHNPIKKAIISTYQSVSGMGLAAMSELTLQSQQVLAGDIPRPQFFPHEIGFNILPQVDVFLDNGYTREEWHLLDETRKIMHNSEILISATCVRVPTFKGHCMALTLEFTGNINRDKAGDILAEAPGVRVMDDTTINLYPQPRTAAGTDTVLVGRIRQDVFNDKGLVMFVAADNIRKGAALSMAQIAEEINKKGWLKAKGRR